MIVDVEVGVIDPERPSTAERNPLQPLPQTRDRHDPLLQYRSQGADIQTIAYVEDQHGADLQRRGCRLEASDIRSSALTLSNIILSIRPRSNGCQGRNTGRT